MRYKCAFCDYETMDRAKIHQHHIQPRESGGNNKQYNLILLCPNHHNLVYCPEAKMGIHSLKSENSIQIIGWVQSSCGKLLRYIDEKGEEKFIKV